MSEVQVSLVVLISVSAFIVLIVGVLIAKLLLNLSTLMGSVNSITKTVDEEAKPILKDVKEIVSSVNTVTSTAGSQLSGLQEKLKSFFGASSNIGSKLKSVVEGLFKGIAFVVKAFTKKETKGYVIR